MGYVKVVKNKQYYKRYKVKFRRRREATTNYRLRRRLIVQDKRKYNTPKWRLIVRISNKDVTCQIASSKLGGDQILCSAYSHELPRYGLKVGLTNYAACYCTGLLLARRCLKKLKLDQYYPGKKKLDGNLFLSRPENIKWKDGRIIRPFKCILDVGLARTSTGARIFGVLKGAVDGGLDVPHSPKRFPGYIRADKSQDDAKDEYQPEEHKNKIFGGHVADYMKLLNEKDQDAYQKQFSQYIKEGVGPDDLEGLYRSVHRRIRANPEQSPKKKRDISSMEIRKPQPKLSTQERRERTQQKIAQLKAGGNAMDTD